MGTYRPPGSIAAPPLSAQEVARPTVTPQGEVARDGSMTFVVDSIVQAPTVSSQYATYTADGVFMIIELTVANVGNAPATYMGVNQKLIVGQRQFGYAGEPTFAISENATSTINPGLSIVTKIVFDVPVGSRPGSIEVHEDTMSRGSYAAVMP